MVITCYNKEDQDVVSGCSPRISRFIMGCNKYRIHAAGRDAVSARKVHEKWTPICDDSSALRQKLHKRGGGGGTISVNNKGKGFKEGGFGFISEEQKG